jgi:hypothetical protein
MVQHQSRQGIQHDLLQWYSVSGMDVSFVVLNWHPELVFLLTLVKIWWLKHKQLADI